MSDIDSTNGSTNENKKRKRRGKSKLPKSEKHQKILTEMILFFSDLVLKHPEKNPNNLAAWGLFAYADGVANQVSAYDIFSCTDLIFMAYRGEMQKKFGLEILTPEEADERERQEAYRRREIDTTDDIERVVDFVKQKRRWEEKYRLS